MLEGQRFAVIGGRELGGGFLGLLLFGGRIHKIDLVYEDLSLILPLAVFVGIGRGLNLALNADFAALLEILVQEIGLPSPGNAVDEIGFSAALCVLCSAIHSNPNITYRDTTGNLTIFRIIHYSTNQDNLVNRSYPLIYYI